MLTEKYEKNIPQQTIVHELFVCEYCNQKYITKNDCICCETRCKCIDEFKQKNKPKFNIGDIVEYLITDYCDDDDDMNYWYGHHFQIKKCDTMCTRNFKTNKYVVKYLYIMEQETYDSYNELYVDASIREDNLKLVMTKREFEKKLKSVNNKIKKEYIKFEFNKF